MREPTGNPGLARGGSGDVLAGMLAALLACGLPAYQAAACAVYLHGAAADRAAAKRGEYGMLPHDILPELAHCLRKTKDKRKKAAAQNTVQLPLFVAVICGSDYRNWLRYSSAERVISLEKSELYLRLQKAVHHWSKGVLPAL